MQSLSVRPPEREYFASVQQTTADIISVINHSLISNDFIVAHAALNLLYFAVLRKTVLNNLLLFDSRLLLLEFTVSE